MKKSDEALVMLTGIFPTNDNVVISLGAEIAKEYRTNPQARPNSLHSFELTPMQLRMVDSATRRKAAKTT